MKKRIITAFLALALLTSCLFGCGQKPAETAAQTGTATQAVTTKAADTKAAETTKAPETEAPPVKGNEEMKLGNFSADGYALLVPADTFSEGSKVEVTEVSQNDLAKYADDEKYEIIGTPVHIVSDGYEGGLFGTDVTLTLPMPEDLDDLEGGLGQLVFLYFNDDGNVEYMLPDSYDSASGTMAVNLPHLSPFGAAKLTEKEQVEMFLDKYATQAAIQKSDAKKAASELEPYVKAKIAALNLTEDAARELSLSVINYVGAQCGDDVGFYTDLTTTAIKSIDKKDSRDFQDKMDEIISGKLYDILNYNLAGGKAQEKFKDVAKAGTIVGAIAGGDTKTALKEIGDVIGNIVPEIGLTTKAVGYVGAKVNECFTNWKSNQIEDLYQKFKNGHEDMWGNEVIAGDEASLKTYLYTSSGLTWSKGVYRFYNMDKVAETCEKYGWGRLEYDELDEHYREIFDKRAEEGLLNYFRTRLQQEAEIEKIKQNERECIEEMMRSYGCLSSGNFKKFFGEQSDDDFNLTARLERIMRVRQMVSEYVDEDALSKSQKDGIYNWGVLMNDWVSLATENKRDDAVKLFISQLKTYGVLNPAYDFGVTMEDIVGTYSGTVTVTDLRVTEEMYQAFMSGEGAGSQYDLDINSKADCDAALDEYIDQIEVGQEITITKTGEDTCVVSGTVTGNDVYPMKAPAVLKDGKLTLTTEEENTEIEVTANDGLITLKSSKAVFLLREEQDGEVESLLIETKIDVLK